MSMLEDCLKSNKSDISKNQDEDNYFYHDYKHQGNLISASFIPGRKIISDLIVIKSNHSKYVEDLQTQKTHYFYLNHEY